MRASPKICIANVCNKQCLLNYFENHLKSKTHSSNINRFSNNWKCCDVCTDNINNSSWNGDLQSQARSANKHMKKHAGFAYTSPSEHKAPL